MITSSGLYSLNHILLLRLLMSSDFKREKTLHNFLYLAAVKSKNRDYPGAYVFIKLRNGVHNFQVQRIISEFKKASFFENSEKLALNRKGRELYYSFAPLLKYHKFPQACLNMAHSYGLNLWQVDHEIFFEPSFKEKKVGEKIILQPVH
ncbi:MAG: hypothetical protein D5R97_02045 [Candidatus Syntrophonatronum acetioxidans]|uniref:Uncharacterized protein n=1 Tax=Candidatus Syntrophonatronum acetioxidans TaxID=1795816 RepID=A0A424YHF7_9FIRM|nr:MAG: hypothetical protein D5R97_02045 [Candidatus Syntrophonatronum acetioxidans]